MLRDSVGGASRSSIGRAYYGPCERSAGGSTTCEPSRLDIVSGMNVTAIAGGVGAGKFLRGLVRAVAPEDVTVVVNTADDVEMHGLLISPDVDSVLYWLGDLADRERGWGRRDETFRATEELR